MLYRHFKSFLRAYITPWAGETTKINIKLSDVLTTLEVSRSFQPAIYTVFDEEVESEAVSSKVEKTEQVDDYEIHEY